MKNKRRMTHASDFAQGELRAGSPGYHAASGKPDLQKLSGAIL